MKVSFEQSGGLAGMMVSTTVDSGSLPKEEASLLQNLVKDANFFTLPSKSEPPRQGAADYFEYTISVENDGLKHTVETTDLTMPESLKPLIRYLRSKLQRKS